MSTSELPPAQPSATLERMEQVVRDLLGRDDIVLTPDTRRSEVKGWDSLANVTIIFGLEEAFQVHFGDEVLAGFDTVGDLALLIDRCRGTAG